MKNGRTRGLRVVYLIENLAGGGAQTALLRLATSLDRSEWAPEVWTFKAGPNQLRSQFNDAGIRVRDYSGLRLNPYTRLDRRSAMILTFRMLWHRPRIVHSFCFYGYGAEAFAVRMARVRNYLVRCSSERWVEHPATWRRKFEAAKRVVVLSEHMKRAYARDFPDLTSKINVIQNGVDSARFKRLCDQDNPEVRRGLGLQHDEILIASVGRLASEKGHEYLLRAVAELPDSLRHRCRVILVGTGPLEDELVRLARELGISNSVRFLGFHEDVIDILQCSDVFVLPSKSEGLSNALLEAMSCGLAVIVTRSGSHELINDGINGLLTPVEDVSALRMQLTRVITDNQLRHDLGNSARETIVQSYSIANTVDATLRLYDELLA